MQMNASQFSGQHARTLRDTLRKSAQRKQTRRIAGWCLGLMLLGLLMLAQGCASKPLTPCEPLPVIQPPALTQPPPSVSYSQQALTNIESWLKLLTDIPVTR